MDVETLVTHSRFIRDLAQQLLRDDDKAEEVAQKTLIAAWKTPPTNEKSARAWLRTVALNFARKAVREEARRTKQERLTPEPKPHAALLPEEILDKETLIRSVVNGVFNLREPYRTVIILRFYENLTSREISQRTGATPGTVRSQIKRAVEELRGDLDHRYKDKEQDWRLGLLPHAGLLKGSMQPPPLTRRVGDLLKSKPVGGVILTTTVSVAVLLTMSLLLWPDDERRDPESKLATKLTTAAQGESIEASVETLLEDPSAALPRGDSSPPTSPEATELDSSTRSQKPTGSLVVAVTWLADGTPAVGVRGMVTLQPRLDRLKVPLRRGQDMNLVSDEKGLFRVDDLPAGSCFLYVDRSIQNTQYEIEPGKTTEDRFRIRYGSSIDVLAVDDRGSPVEGAEVLLASRDRKDDFGVIVGHTKSDGTYRVRHLSIDTYVGVRASGYSPPRMPSLRSRDTHQNLSLRFVLKPGDGQIKGIVRDFQGHPIRGAKLIVESLLNPKTGRLESGHDGMMTPPFLVTTDEDGSYLVDGAWKGPVQILVQAKGHVPFLERANLEKGLPLEYDIVLDQPATLTGRVVDPEGTPLPQSVITVTDSAMCEFRETLEIESTETGEFSIRRLPPGTVSVQAHTPSGASTTKTFELPPGSETHWLATVSYGREILGKLTDEKGKPLAGWRVQAQSPYSAWKDVGGEERERRREASSQTDEHGFFRIANREESLHLLRVFSPNQWSSDPCYVVRDVLPDGIERTLVLPDDRHPTAYLEGQLFYAGEKPVTYTMLQLFEVGRQGYAGRIDLPEDGSFSFGPLSPGTYALTVNGMVLGHRVLQPYRLRPHERRDLGRVDLGHYGSFRAEVRLENDQPFERPNLRLVDETRRLSSPLYFNGRFAMANYLWPGKYRFCVTGSGQTRVGSQGQTVEIFPGQETSTTITLHHGAKRFLHFEEPSGSPGWTTAMIAELLDLNGELLWTGKLRRNEEGLFIISVYATPGTYQVRGFGDGGLSVLKTIEVKGLDEDTFRLPLVAQD